MSQATPPAAPDTAPPRAGFTRSPLWHWTRRALAVLAAVVAAIALLFFTIDIGRFGQLKTRAETAASNYLERPMHIGRLSATLWPGVFALDNVVIDGKHPGDRPFLTAGRIYAYVPWWTLFRRELVVELRLTNWRMVVEMWPDGSSQPRLTPKSTGAPRAKLPFTTTVPYVYALGGEFIYDDHLTPWQVQAPNLSFSLVRAENLKQYVGQAAFADGVVQIQSYRPMKTAMTTRFSLDGPRVALEHIDLVTDGSVSHVSGYVDFSRWPEQTYNVNSSVDFARMRDIFFANETWRLAGSGQFTGIFHLFKDGTRTGRELVGDFESDDATVNDLQFSDLHGSLVWTPDLFAVTHADADFLGGGTRFSYSMAPLGRPGGSTATFSADYSDVDLAGVNRLIDLKSLQIAGRANGNLRLQWPTGQFRSGAHGTGHTDVTPPAGIQMATAALPAVPRAVIAEPTPFQSARPFAPLAIGADVDYAIDPDVWTFQDSWAATPFTYVSFGGRLAQVGASQFPFHATSHDWQESDRVLTRIMTAVSGPTRAIEVGGRGTFDGVMTGTFSAPRIAGRFAGESTRVWDVNWGRAEADVVIENRFVDISASRFGDNADASIAATGKFALGYQDVPEEINAKVVLTNWPMKDLRHAFALDDWPMDGVIGQTTLMLHGKYREMFGTGPLRIDHGVAWGESFESATGDVELEGTGLRVHRIEMKKGAGLVHGDARVGWDGTYAFNADGEGIPVESLDSFKIEQAPLSGRLRFTASGAGPFDTPNYTFRGSIDDLYAGDQGVGRVQGQIRVAGKTLSIEQLTASSGLLDVAGRGTIELNDRSDADLHLRFTQASIDPYLKFVAPTVSPYTRAILSGSVDVRGPLGTPTQLSVDASIDDATLTLFDYELKNDGPVRLAYQDNVFRVGQPGPGGRAGSLKLKGADTSLELTGGANARDRVWDLSAAGNASLSILQLFFPGMTSSGSATLKASLTGPFDHPKLTGDATLANGRLRPLASPHSLEAINGRIRFDESGINFNDPACAPRCLTGRIGNGDVVFGGTIGLDGYRLARYDLTATGRSINLRYPVGFASTVNMDLALAGPFETPRLTGNIDVLKVNLVARGGSDTGLLGLAAGGTTGAGVSLSGAGQTLVQEGIPLALDIQVTAPRMAFTPDKTVTLYGRAALRVGGTFDRPVIGGAIDILGGEVFFLGNRYYVRDGAINFTPDGVPVFDISAETRPRVSGQTYDVNVTITGPLDVKQISMNLQSDPSLPETDIVSLLFGGTPQLSTIEQRQLRSPQESQQRMMQTTALMLVTSPISSRVGDVAQRLLPLDTVQITPSLGNDVAFQQLNPSARITLGQRISQRVFLTYSRTLGNNAVLDEIYVLEYDENDRVSWVLSRNEDHTFALDLRIRYVH